MLNLQIFYSSHLPHYPAQIPREYLIDDPYNDDINDCSAGRFEFVYPGLNDPEQYKCRTITQSQVNLLDEIVGQIVDKLKANDLWDNTLLIFQSDNVCPRCSHSIYTVMLKKSLYIFT